MYSARSDGRKWYRVRLHSILRCALAIAILGLHTERTLAQCAEEQKLTASDAAANDQFGVSVSVSGDTVMVGAFLDDCVAGVDCGSAYVFRFDGTSWVMEQKLTASDAGAFDHFGNSISVSGDTAVVGTHLDGCKAGNNCGSTYVFRFNETNWVEEQKLTASDAAVNDSFGVSVSVSGDTTVVGAWLDDCAAGGGNCGSAYVFRFNGTNWVEEQKLTASDAGENDFFGFSVSVSGDTAVVGADRHDCAAGSDCGSAYAYRFDGTGWVEEQKLTASDAGAGDNFGHSVSVSGDTIVVGAFFDQCATGGDCGSAYVFRFNGTSWVAEQRLTASDAVLNDFFGEFVSVSREMIVVGAKQDDCAAGNNCGSAYVFRFNGISWVEEQMLTAVNAGEHDQFGFPVSLSGDTAVVGARFSDCAVDDGCGSAYVFSCASSTVVNLDIKPGSCPNPVNPRSKGVVPVALVGSLEFDVNTVDLDSLTLARVDGVGGSVTPLSDRRGSRIAIEDLVTPFGDEPCTCHDLGGDGMDDLSLKFLTAELSRTLELHTLPRGESIELVLRGTLFDGTTFEATDCITIPGRSRNSARQGNSSNLHRTHKP